MASGSAFGSGNTIEVPFGTAPSNSGSRFPTNDNVKLTSLGRSDGFDVFRIRNGTEEEITVTLEVPGAPNETSLVIPANTDLIVCTQSTDGGTFRVLEEPSGNLLATSAAIGENADGEAPEFDSEFSACFAPETMIATPDGERAVQNLSIGDHVLTDDGRSVPIKWIGVQTVIPIFQPPERSAPVRITKDAFGPCVPHQDLVLTADHALICEGFAIIAGALVNGSTIRLDPTPERATYYHIETEDHEVILANGVPAETYVDYAGRRVFDNYAQYIALYGEDKTIDEMPLPRITAARLVPPRIRDRLAAGRTAA
jgi:hypothetical protein